MEIMRKACLAIKTTLTMAFLIGLLFLIRIGYEIHVIPLPVIVSAVLYVAIAVGLVWKLTTSEF